MGHEFIGIVEAVGADVRTIKVGDLVAAPFAWSDGTCIYCQEGLHTSCLHGGFWGGTKLDGGQGEAVRVPQADGTLYPLPVGRDNALNALASHPDRCDGYRSSCSCLSQSWSRENRRSCRRRRGWLVRCHRREKTRSRTDHPAGSSCQIESPLPKNSARPILSASAERKRLRVCANLTNGLGVQSVLECVGYEESTLTALSIARPGWRGWSRRCSSE